MLVTAAATLAVWTANARAYENGPITYTKQVGASKQIMQINQDGSGGRQLTFDVYSKPYAAASFDGTKIVFELLTQGVSYPFVASQLTLVRSQIFDYSVDGIDISPDGSTVAYEVIGAGVYLAGVDGSNARLVDSSVWARNPRFSPDGTQLVYVRRSSSASSTIFVKSLPDLSTVKSLTYDNVSSASISADSTRVIFAAGTTNNRQLRSWALKPNWHYALTSTAGNRYDPEISPDGAKVVYEFQPETSSTRPAGIYVMDLKAGTEEPLVTDESARSPSWQKYNASEAMVPPEDNGAASGFELQLKRPKASLSRRKKMSRRQLGKVIGQGFSASLTGYGQARSISASLYYRRSRNCYLIDSFRRKKCTATNGVGVDFGEAQGSSLPFTYKPLATWRKGRNIYTRPAKQLLRQMRKGKHLRKGLYQLRFTVKLADGDSTKTKTVTYSILAK